MSYQKPIVHAGLTAFFRHGPFTRLALFPAMGTRTTTCSDCWGFLFARARRQSLALGAIVATDIRLLEPELAVRSGFACAAQPIHPARLISAAALLLLYLSGGCCLKAGGWSLEPLIALHVEQSSFGA
jgi:hypothetical protein